MSNETEYKVVIDPREHLPVLPSIGVLRPGTVFEGPRATHIYLKLSNGALRPPAALAAAGTYAPCLYLSSHEGFITWLPRDDRPRKIFKKLTIGLTS